MFKILVLFLILFNFISSPSFGEKIDNIKIDGNKRISKETIILLGEINNIIEFDNDTLNSILNKIYDTGFFKDVKISLDDNILNIKVEENPIIEEIEINGLKSDKFRESLLNNIELKSRMSFSENKLNKDIIRINNILKANGLYFSKVNSNIIKNEDLNSIKIILSIDEGKKARIKNIRFIGNKIIKDKNLLEIIASEEHKFWKFISRNVYLNESQVNLDKRLLENYYKNQGFYKVEVLSSFAEIDESENFTLTYNIDSGDKFFFNNLKLNLPTDYNSDDFQKVTKILNNLNGKEYSINRFKLILDEIDNIATSKLYEFIDVKVDEKIIDMNKIDIVFNVVEAEKFYVEKINIFGNYQTIEEVIRNKLIVDEGDPLNQILLNKSINDIRSLGIFKNVKSDIKSGTESNFKIIDISLEEQPTGEISLAAGAGTSGNTIGGGIVEKNFLGKGINLSTNIEISEESLKGRFIYSKPNFAYTDNTLFTSLEATTLDYLTDYGYKLSKTGFSIGTTFEQYQDFYFSPEVSISFENLDTDSSASSQLKKQQGSYEDLFFNNNLSYDQRDSSYNPKSGYNVNFYQKIPVISESQELSNTIIFNKYKNLIPSSDMIGKLSVYLEHVNSLNNSDVRVSKRAQIPYNRLRGFEKGKVGPVDNGDFVGGNYISSLNLSTNLPQILKTVENIDFLYFIDLANVWGVDYSSTIDDASKLRSSTGVGMNFLTPVGPLSFSLSKPITKHSNDKTETFRFNLGTSF